MKKILLSVCMLLVSTVSFASYKTYKINIDKTYGFEEIETLFPVELSSNKNIEIISDYLDISKKYSMTNQGKKTFIINHPQKTAKTTLFVKYDSGEVTKLKINFISNNDYKESSLNCNFKLTDKSANSCIN